jgi:hypothetical protein
MSCIYVQIHHNTQIVKSIPTIQQTTLEITASSTTEPKRRKAKKDAVTKLHSESQRLVRGIGLIINYSRLTH